MPTPSLTLVGLGPGPLHWLSIGALAALDQAACILTSAPDHPAVAALRARGLVIADGAAVLALAPAEAAAHLRTRAQTDGPLVFALPGSLRGETAWVAALTAEPTLAVAIWPGVSALELLRARVALGEQLTVADIRDPRWDPRAVPLPEAPEAFHGRPALSTALPVVWVGIDTPDLARALVARLGLSYPPAHAVTVASELGTAVERLVSTTVGELSDQLPSGPDVLVSVPALPWAHRPFTLEDLRAIMRLLRSAQGCPWDREQGMQDLRRTVIEEAYEVADAIDRGHPPALVDELGDLLLNIVFLAQLGQEQESFTFDEVVGAIAEKLIRRHAHVFGPVAAETAAAVLRSWEQIKAGERVEKGEHSLFADVPAALPALARSQKLQKRAARVGFDWADFRGPLLKLHEELEELSEELGIPDRWERPALLEDDPLTPNPGAQARAAAAPRARVIHELGDILFAAVNLSRFLQVDAEEVMREANDRFVRRFHRLEAAVRAQGQRVEALSVQELDAIWLTIKGDD
jgi:tetrapyrrole methylase family protein/MazG family protein